MKDGPKTDLSRVKERGWVRWELNEITAEGAEIRRGGRPHLSAILCALCGELPRLLDLRVLFYLGGDNHELDEWGVPDSYDSCHSWLFTSNRPTHGRVAGGQIAAVGVPGTVDAPGNLPPVDAR